MGEASVDLRSDTVTRPTEAMRRAMAAAEVGDDVYGEDPTVNRLQDRACELTGTEAALYVPTGTMANQLAVRVYARPGAEVVCHEDCHLIHHESGATAILSGVQLRGLRGEKGLLDADHVRAAVRPDDPYQPDTCLVEIENTHNAAGGTVWPIEQVRAVADAAHDAGLPLFCDGARIVHACVATGTSLAEYSAPCDLVTFSLYKALAAPMGSLLCGPRDVIEEAWRWRRIYGGALRQAGVVAAAGLVALDEMWHRVDEDHGHALLLASGLASVAPDGTVPVDDVETNMVLFRCADAGLDPASFLGALKREGVLAGLIAPGVVRFVTHPDVDRDGIDRAVRAFASVLKELR